MSLSAADIRRYNDDGYLIVENVFTPEEVQILLRYVDLNESVASFGDAGQRVARLKFWSDLGGHIWGAATICPRIINRIRMLQGEDVGFFHGKVTLKEAHTGGAWEWHQDYGYWYNQGFIYPRMMSVAVALDDNTVENGCMQLLRGSHKLGRLNHTKVGSQIGVEPERMAAVEPHFERIPAIMPAGAGLFFDCNTLHASSANDSDRHRRNFIMCYNALANPQIGERKTFQQVPCPVGAEDIVVRRHAELQAAATAAVGPAANAGS